MKSTLLSPRSREPADESDAAVAEPTVDRTAPGYGVMRPSDLDRASTEIVLQEVHKPLHMTAIHVRHPLSESGTNGNRGSNPLPCMTYERTAWIVRLRE
jgi:hypothetical protein